ncbi:MAG: dienelactone hydrolase family protein [Betaproteobacteria bacterium]|nr:MAG: dienelactone hydrolase family protein [Betaproteobacteria bacterium]
MNSRWIDIKASDGGTLKGYLSLPPGAGKTGKGPGIVLIQEIFGVNSHIRAVADQYASDGYTVLAPDLFWRMQPMVELGYGQEDFKTGIGYMQKFDFAAGLKDLAATVAALRALPEGGGKVASVGYCMGGMLSYLCAANAGVDAAVCYYGGGIHTKLDEAGKIKCPVLFHFAGNDSYIPAAAVEAVKQTFAGRESVRIDVYPGVDHGFNCWDRAAYNQQSAALARGRSLAFLATNIS